MPTFEKIRVVSSIWANKEQLLWLGFGGQDGDGGAHAVDGDSVWGRHLPWESHLRGGHGRQARTDLVQVQQVAGSLLSSLL